MAKDKPRQIRADLPVPTKRSSEWAFTHSLKDGESFLCYGSEERNSAATYGRNQGWKIISRIDNKLSRDSNAMVYRLWKTIT